MEPTSCQTSRGNKVRFWRISDVQTAPMNVRFEGENGHDADVTPFSLMTHSGHGFRETLERNFECARKALRIEFQFGSTELTAECTLYEVCAEAHLLWRTDLRAAALLPNEFNRSF